MLLEEGPLRVVEEERQVLPQEVHDLSGRVVSFRVVSFVRWMNEWMDGEWW